MISVVVVIPFYLLCFECVFLYNRLFILVSLGTTLYIHNLSGLLMLTLYPLE